MDEMDFQILIGAHGRFLSSVNYEAFLPIEEPLVFDGSLELQFDGNIFLQVTMAHQGVRVYPDRIYPDPDHCDVPTEIRNLKQGSIGIGKRCLDILAMLEVAQSRGRSYVIGALVFDFESIRIGYENFSPLYGIRRSHIVTNPNWTCTRIVSLISGEIME